MKAKRFRNKRLKPTHLQVVVVEAEVGEVGRVAVGEVEESSQTTGWTKRQGRRDLLENRLEEEEQTGLEAKEEQEVEEGDEGIDCSKTRLVAVMPRLHIPSTH